MSDQHILEEARAPTIRNTSGIDIVATKGKRTVNIQVKTNSYGRIKYPMSKSNEKLIADNLARARLKLRARKKDKESKKGFWKEGGIDKMKMNRRKNVHKKKQQKSLRNYESSKKKEKV